MAALDFPASPTLNQTYPSPAVPGVPVYTWDGEKWTTTGGAVGSTGAADDPPLMDGTASVGSSTQWAREDHRHPTDTAIAAGYALKVAKAGDTMTGSLLISPASVDAQIQLHKSASGLGNYISSWVGSLARWSLQLGNAIAESGANAGSELTIQYFNDAGALVGTAFTASRADGLITVKGDPTAALGVATKQYVDTGNNATAAEYIANSAPTKKLTSGAVWTAAAGFPVFTGAALTPDLANATDFGWVNNSSAGALNNPTNLKVGQKGVIYVWQDGVGGRLITTWGSFFKFPGGIKPVLSTAPNAVDAISYAVYNSNYIMCTFSAGFA